MVCAEEVKSQSKRNLCVELLEGEVDKQVRLLLESSVLLLIVFTFL